MVGLPRRFAANGKIGALMEERDRSVAGAPRGDSFIQGAAGQCATRKCQFWDNAGGFS